MAYYGRPSMNRGDYYRGDYYRGDPGFFSFIGKGLKAVARVVGGAAVGYLGGGIKGAIGGAVGGTVRGVIQGTQEETLEAGDTGSAYTPALRAAHAAVLTAHPGGGIMHAPPGMGLVGPMGLRVRRTHPNRSTYVTRGGGTSRWPVGLQVHPKGTEAVTSRRMNVGNARALRRSLRRLRGFAKLARKVLATSHQFKGGKRRAVARRR